LYFLCCSVPRVLNSTVG